MSYELETIWRAMKGTHYSRILNELKDGIMQAENLNDALVIALNKVVSAAHAEAGTFWFFDRFGDGLIRPMAVYGGSELGDVTLNLGEGVAGKVVQTGVASIIADCQQDPRWAGRVDAKTGFTTRTMICVPLNWKRFTFGSIQIINKTDGIAYDEKDLVFVQGLAMQVAQTFESRGLLSDYVVADQIAREVSSREQTSPGFDEIFCLADFADVEETLYRTDAMDALSASAQRNVLRHAREIWLILEKNGLAVRSADGKMPEKHKKGLFGRRS